MKPVRIVEAEWTFDRQRYLRSLQLLELAPLPAMVFGFQAVAHLIRGKFIDFFVELAAMTIALGVVAIWRRRAIAYMRAQYRAPEPTTDEVGLVVLELAVGKKAYASDLGILTVGRSSITFEGAQATFSVSPSRWRRRQPDPIDHVALVSDDWAGRVLRIKPVPRVRALRDLQMPVRSELDEAFDRTLGAEDEAPSVVAVPPRHMQDSNRPSPWPWVGFVVASGLFCASVTLSIVEIELLAGAGLAVAVAVAIFRVAKRVERWSIQRALRRADAETQSLDREVSP